MTEPALPVPTIESAAYDFSDPDLTIQITFSEPMDMWRDGAMFWTVKDGMLDPWNIEETSWLDSTTLQIVASGMGAITGPVEVRYQQTGSPDYWYRSLGGVYLPNQDWFIVEPF